MLSHDLIDIIGRAPLLRLRLGADRDVEVYAKCEALGPGGPGARSGVQAVRTARSTGALAEHAPVLVSAEAPAGRAVALAGRRLGHPVHVVATEHTAGSVDPELTALGCRLHVVPGAAEHDAAMTRLLADLPDAWCPAPAEQDGLAEELADELDWIDILVGADTVLPDTATALRARLPGLRAVGVRCAPRVPCGQIHPACDELHSFDEHEASGGVASLARDEALFAGPVSGAVYRVLGALAANAAPGTRIVGVLPDHGKPHATGADGAADAGYRRAEAPSATAPRSIAADERATGWSRRSRAAGTPRRVVLVECGVDAVLAAARAGLSPVLLGSRPQHAPEGTVLRCDTTDPVALRRAASQACGRDAIAAVLSTSDTHQFAAARLAAELGVPGPDPEAVTRGAGPDASGPAEFTVAMAGDRLLGVLAHPGPGRSLLLSQPPADVVAAVRAELPARGLRHGPSCTGVRRSPQGPVVTAVVPGLTGGALSRSSRLFRHATGTDLLSAQLLALTGDHEPPVPADGVTGLHELPVRETTDEVSGVELARALPGVVEVTADEQPGRPAGHVIARAATRAQVLAVLDAAAALVTVRPAPRRVPYPLVGREAATERSVVRVGGSGTGPVDIGPDTFTLIAGPCAVETPEQTRGAALLARSAGATLLRGGAFKPRSSPYDFRGLREDGLRILADVSAETGLPVVTEVVDSRDVDLVAGYADMLQIGTRNMQNFGLLEAAADSGLPILLKRGMSATIQEWLLAAEYVALRGNTGIVLCERGIRTFEPATRNTLDLSAVLVAQGLSHLPVVVDPSHAGGRRDLVLPLVRAAAAVGADGVMLDVHPQPEAALCDAKQALDAAELDGLAEAVRDWATLAGRLSQDVLRCVTPPERAR